MGRETSSGFGVDELDLERPMGAGARTQSAVGCWNASSRSREMASHAARPSRSFSEKSANSGDDTLARDEGYEGDDETHHLRLLPWQQREVQRRGQ
jgi:hypothetical protein